MEAFSGHRELREGSLIALVLTCWPLLARPRTAGGRCLDHQCQHRLSSCWQVVPGTTVPPARLYIYIISTYPHIYTMKHTWPGVSITDHTGQWPGPEQCWFMRVIHVIEFSPNIFTVYSVYIVSTHCDACFGQHWTHQIIFILPRRYTIHLEMKKNQDIAELFTCVFFKHSL